MPHLDSPNFGPSLSLQPHTYFLTPPSSCPSTLTSSSHLSPTDLSSHLTSHTSTFPLMSCPPTPNPPFRPPSHTRVLRTPPLPPWVCLNSKSLSAGVGGQRNQLREASMENGERKKLSSTLSDGDHKEENSLYLSFLIFDNLTQRSRCGGLGIAEEAQIQLPSGLLRLPRMCWSCETVLVVQGKTFLS